MQKQKRERERPKDTRYIGDGSNFSETFDRNTLQNYIYVLDKRKTFKIKIQFSEIFVFSQMLR